MKKIILLTFVLFSQLTYAESFELDDPFLNYDPNHVTVVDNSYRQFFKKKIFEEEIKRIESEIEADAGKTKLMIFSVKNNQGYFVSRYFKKILYDAYFKDDKVYIYTKRHMPFKD